MNIEIAMPKLGLTMTRGIVDSIKVKIGDFVKEGDELITIETDKIASLIEAPNEGYIIDIIAKEGEEYKVTEVLCVLSDDKDAVYVNNIKAQKADTITNDQSEAYVEVVEDVKQNDTDRIFITPVARMIAKQNEIDITTLKRKHNKDRIVKKDVLDAADKRQTDTDLKKQDLITDGDIQYELKGARRVIAERLSYSKQHIPHAYFSVKVNCDKLIEVKSNMEQPIFSVTGLKITLNDLIIKAVLNALKDFKEFNCNYVDDVVTKFDNINIGIAMDTDTGLVVPNIKKAERLTLTEIKKAVNILSRKAKASTLSLEEINGGTFTISNLGAYKIDMFSAIIKPPEVAILAVSTISKNPLVIDGILSIANTMNIYLSVDHRIIDGALACQFINAVKFNLENPFMLLV